MSEELCKYVSSKGIAKSCDIQVFTIDDFNNIINNVKETPTIYVHVNFIKTLKTNLHLINYRFVLVTGSGDYTNPNDFFNNEKEFLDFINNDKIIRWYSQNCIIEHEKIIKIPIGLDYHTLSANSHYWGIKMNPIEQENELLVICNSSKPFWERIPQCYSNFHFIDYNNKFGYTRQDIINMVSKELVFYEPNQITRTDTWKNQSKYAFVISPFGNGLDCHRTWEALILGCIVIVKKSQIDCLYENLPVLIVDDWSDINRQLLENTVLLFKDKQFDYSRLTLTNYIQKMNTKD
jgi:hypothetical protein